MSANNSKHTVAAALGRQERDSEAIGAKTPQERQQVVSLGLDEKADREGRVWAGPSET